METQTFLIEYQGEIVKVVSQWDGDREVFRLEWPDDTLDFLFMDLTLDPPGWNSETILASPDIAALGKLIEEKTGG